MKSALVIGSSDGIGLAVASALVSQGWSVEGLSRSGTALSHPMYRHTIVDVAEPEYRTKLASLVAAETPFDACIYCVGVGDMLDLADLARDRRTFEVNLLAAVSTLEIVVPSMLRAKKGHVIVLSSQADGLVSSLAPAYHASKAGLSSYVEGLALALRGTGVSATNVRFGFVDTKMAKSDVKPFMISAAAAARVVVRELDRKRIRITHPLPMAALIWLMAFATWLKIFWG